MRKILLLAGLAGSVMLGGCEMIEYHPYDARIKGDRDINRRNTERIEAACLDKPAVRFVMMGDSQRWYDETEDFVKHINARTDIDFVIHGGDMSDFGMTREFEWMRDIMNGLKVPYVALIGNHDVLGNGAEVYHRIFGPANFSFIAGRTKFVCLNTNALEYDYSQPIPDFGFLKKELTGRTDEYESTVAVMHVKPGSEQFNNNVADVFQEQLLKFPRLRFCLNAHNHRLEKEDLFGDGVLYYGSSCMKDRSYLLFTLTPDGYEYEVVCY